MTGRGLLRPVIGLALIVVILQVSCGQSVETDSKMTYDVAAKKLRALVEGGLAAGLDGKAAPTAEPVSSEVCTNSEGVSTSDLQPYYEREFSIEVLGENPDAFVLRAGRFLAQAGLKITADDDPGVTRRFATNEEFGLEVFVSRVSGRVLIGGTGPCVKAPSPNSRYGSR